MTKDLTKEDWLDFLVALAIAMKREDFTPDNQPKFTYRDVKNNLRAGKPNDNLTRDEWAEKWFSRVLSLDVLKDEWAAFLRGSKELSLFTDLHCYHNLLAKPNLEKKPHYPMHSRSDDNAEAFATALVKVLFEEQGRLGVRNPEKMRIIDMELYRKAWVDQETAVERLGCATRHIRRLVEQGYLEKNKAGKIKTSSLIAELERRGDWHGR